MGFKTVLFWLSTASGKILQNKANDLDCWAAAVFIIFSILFIYQAYQAGSIASNLVLLVAKIIGFYVIIGLIIGLIRSAKNSQKIQGLKKIYKIKPKKGESWNLKILPFFSKILAGDFPKAFCKTINHLANISFLHNIISGILCYNVFVYETVANKAFISRKNFLFPGLSLHTAATKKNP